MYTVILLILVFLGIRLIYLGIQNTKKRKIITGAVILGLTALFFWFMSFWADKLWFDSAGFGQRFWLEIITKAALILTGAIISFILVYYLTRPIRKENIFYHYLGLGIGVLYGVIWGHSNWDLVLRFFNRVTAGITEPILNQDASFYLFNLPFYEEILNFIIIIFIISAGAVLLSMLSGNRNGPVKTDIHVATKKEGRMLILGGSALFFLLAIQKYIARFDILFSDFGSVAGPGWTDVHVKLPGLLITAILTLIIGLIFAFPAWRNKIAKFLQKKNVPYERNTPAVFGILFGSMLVVWLLVLNIIPGGFQWLRVEPNEITMESPYIKNNIDLTRYAFELNNIEEKEYPVSETFNQKTVDENPGVFSNIRLWDWRALDEVYKQFQEIRLYYEFENIDIDRYYIDSTYQQVMVSAREMETGNLPEQSKTFVNKRFKYTHGYGITLTKVNEFTENGLPNLLIRDIPPKHKYPELEVKRPEIYYGELTNSHVVSNSDEKEFDYPSGDKNVYTNYDGNGGVQLTNLWRKFLFGWKFDGTRFFFSGYPNENSRIMFNRNIRERVNKIAPFLKFDRDPYVVLADGNLYWIIDAYTTSRSFPYSKSYDSRETIEFQEGDTKRELNTRVASHLHGVNYTRNSVKITINAFNGNMDFYVFNEEDPIINVWQKIFPDMFQGKDEMPEELSSHIRYPIDKMLVQGQVYAKYHMTDPTVFYNQEDLWVRATEKYYSSIKPVEPYYIIWERPESKKPEYVLMQPFTPKNRQVLIGWVAGMCDGENYGNFLAYKFPKEKRILGPQQVETKIDQDANLSGQLTLWDQRGSNVIRGNVLAIPVNNTIIYVEPIYLQSETAAYPELRLVAVMHNDKLSYADNFQDALKGIFSEEVAPKVPLKKKEERKESSGELIKQANQALNDYLKLTGEGNFEKAAKAMKKLKNTLNQLEENKN